MYCACTIRSFYTSLVMLSDFVRKFLGHDASLVEFQQPARFKLDNTRLVSRSYWPVVALAFCESAKENSRLTFWYSLPPISTYG